MRPPCTHSDHSSMDDAVESTAWPENCCVPALLHDAARRFGVTVEPRALALDVGVRMAEGDENPWGLPVAVGGATPGVELRSVLGRWKSLSLFLTHGLSLEFYPLRDLTIPVESWLEAKHDCYVGIGLDYARYFGATPPRPAKHVLRLVRTVGGRAVVFDPSRPSLGFATWDLRRLENSIEAVDDGFWIISRLSADPAGRR